MKDFVFWSEEIDLQLNITKTKELAIDFGKSRTCPYTVVFSGDNVEILHSYKYLCICVARLDMETGPPLRDGPE